MALKLWRFVAVLISALACAMGFAHLLEMPAKMGYDGSMYAAVNRTLYGAFASVGGACMVGAILICAALAYRVRRRAAFRATAAAAALLLAGFLAWLALVAPVNAEWARALRSAEADVPAAYLRLRSRWEYGHVVSFAFTFAGFAALVGSLLAEIPRDARPAAA